MLGRRAHDDFADVAATGIEDVVERAFQQFAGFLGPAFDTRTASESRYCGYQLSKELDVFGESSDGFKQTVVTGSERISIGSKASSTG